MGGVTKVFYNQKPFANNKSAIVNNLEPFQAPSPLPFDFLRFPRSHSKEGKVTEKSEQHDKKT